MLCFNNNGAFFYCSHGKYRYLRLSYICFLTGFIAAVIIEAAHLMR